METLVFFQGKLCIQSSRLPKSYICVDFNDKQSVYRRATGLRKNEVFVKAVGGLVAADASEKQRPLAVDLTAGLGRDAFLLSCMGYRVIALEKNPMVFQLLLDGYERALKDPSLAQWLGDRLEFLNIDAIDYLEKDIQADIIFMDPMFPIKKKTALSSKEMQVMQSLCQTEPVEEEQMLRKALAVAQNRVVVKRPLWATEILPGVTHSYRGSSVRYDMYKAFGERAV